MPAKEFQPGQSFYATAVLPNNITTFSLSGGREAPFYFYLGANSTVPFVQLESPVSQKEISWGDLAELPPGSNVSVRNISYMPGDIQIQSGRTPIAPPRRTCISVSLVKTAANIFTPEYPCDTRRAVRAYFSVALDPEAWIVTVTGSYKQHSRNAHTHTPAAYIDSFDYDNSANPSAVVPPMIPLGTSLEGNSMRLADLAELAFTSSNTLTAFPDNIDAFYVLEY